MKCDIWGLGGLRINVKRAKELQLGRLLGRGGGKEMKNTCLHNEAPLRASPSAEQRGRRKSSAKPPAGATAAQRAGGRRSGGHRQAAPQGPLK